MNQNGYHPQGMQGYGSQSPGFSQNAGYSDEPPYVPGSQPPPYEGYRQAPASGYVSQGYPPQQINTPPNPYAQGSGQNVYQNPQQAGYPPYEYQPQPYQNTSGSAGPYFMPPQQDPNGGSFIPQTPYSPGYTSPGYQPQQGYQSGYSPYNQMGRTPRQNNGQPEFSQSIPLNGGGYVPQKVPVRRKPFVLRDWHLILFGILLAGLFVFSVFVAKSPVLKIVLIVLAAGSAAVLWVKPFVAENKRLTYSIVALALCVLTAVSFLLKTDGDKTNVPNENGQQGAQANVTTQDGVPVIPAENGNTLNSVPDEPTAEPVSQDDSLMTRLVSFFKYWSGNRQDEMLSLCAPSWLSKQENPRTSLFSLLGNRFPKDCTPESITGTDADTIRKVTLTTTIDRNNGKDPEKFRMTVLMLKENNEWYVDPQSLLTNEIEETPDPNITPTPAPTETPAVYPNTPLYYNPNGGEYYHADPNCKIINSKYIPLQGQFTYAEINNEPYSKLKPCNVCGAPLRE